MSPENEPSRPLYDSEQRASIYSQLRDKHDRGANNLAALRLAVTEALQRRLGLTDSSSEPDSESTEFGRTSEE
ncbi:MAG: hypothetical protein QG629_5 [Patescibacteria group bacterium]|nr:hypothetical protein [Candidatus Saccharibacteria bacterium]MDQ5962923.1 hypothetical protein [Patescibacteria group bacterium]